LTSVLSSGDEGLSAYLESLGVPAALLDREQKVLCSNNRFRALTINRIDLGLRVGEALDCMYTGTLGRCGETVACLLCRLKRSVDHTWHTGEGLRGVQISYPHKAESRRAFTITTEKVGVAVLLMVEVSPGK
jgi:hypothetical protein